MFEKYDKAAELFVSNMERDELSADSVESYSRTYRMFRESMIENGYTEVCDAAVVDFKLSKKDAALTTIALYLTHLRLLSEFAVEVGIMDEGFVPDALMPSRKKLAAARNKKYSHVLTEAQIAELITADRPKYGRKSHTWLREKAEVTLLLQSGLRNSELRSLTPDDLDFENSVIYARITKGDKPRYVAFPQAAQKAVRAYLASPLRPTWVKPSEPLFGSVSRNTGKWVEMERSKLSERIKHYTAGILGEEASCRTHALRHGYSSYLLERGVNMEEISESLGHSSLTTTKIYAERFTQNTPARNIGQVFNDLEAV